MSDRTELLPTAKQILAEEAEALMRHPEGRPGAAPTRTSPAPTLRLRFLVTAGPTLEYLDPVRFVSNASTGKMGYACAAAAVRRGHRVTLVSGPVALEPPQGVRLARVVSAEQMNRAVRRLFPRCDAVIMTAAVADYRPRRRAGSKIAKTAQPLILELVPTVDILAGLGRAKKRQVLIGFALQDRGGRTHAERKLREKNLDAIVLNGPRAAGADRLDVQVLVAGGGWSASGGCRGLTKAALGVRLVRLAERLAGRKRRTP